MSVGAARYGRAVHGLATAVGLVAALACAQPRPLGAPAAALRVVTWNVHDLFDERDDPGNDTVLSRARVEAKLATIAEVLRPIEADVVVLQEVEHLALLDRLVKGPLAGMGYRAFLVEGNDERGIDVGVLSRVPVVRYESHARDRDGKVWSRDLVEAHLEVAGARVVVLATHLVSRRFPGNDARRRRQAERAREIADAARRAQPSATVIVAGDLNDEPRSRALEPLLGDGAWVGATDGHVPEAERWTYSHERYGRSTVDYLLLPRDAARRVTGARILPDPDGPGREWDHRPVVVELDLRR